MTTERDGLLDEPMSNEVPAKRTESGFAHEEREGAEAMSRRPLVLDEDKRVVTDPGQDMRSPEEEPNVRQAQQDPNEGTPR